MQALTMAFVSGNRSFDQLLDAGPPLAQRLRKLKERAGDEIGHRPSSLS
jgi:hypothetical protein